MNEGVSSMKNNAAGTGLIIFWSIMFGLLLGTVDEPLSCVERLFDYADMLKIGTIIVVPGILGYFAGRESKT
jgi:hypothetical protein